MLWASDTQGRSTGGAAGKVSDFKAFWAAPASLAIVRWASRSGVPRRESSRVPSGIRRIGTLWSGCVTLREPHPASTHHIWTPLRTTPGSSVAHKPRRCNPRSAEAACQSTDGVSLLVQTGSERDLGKPLGSNTSLRRVTIGLVSYVGQTALRSHKHGHIYTGRRSLGALTLALEHFKNTHLAFRLWGTNADFLTLCSGAAVQLIKRVMSLFSFPFMIGDRSSNMYLPVFFNGWVIQSAVLPFLSLTTHLFFSTVFYVNNLAKDTHLLFRETHGNSVL